MFFEPFPHMLEIKISARARHERTSDYDIFLWKISVAGSNTVPGQEKYPTQGWVFFLVAGAGLEPATSWL
jgi:hypothetical protein